MRQPVLFLFIFFILSCRPGGPVGEVVQDAAVLAVDITFANTPGDSLFFENVLKKVFEGTEPETDVSMRMIAAGMAFTGTPYVASTLEVEGEERLVVNLLGVDCTTFVEYVTALTLSSMKGEVCLNEFARQLASIRYRDGLIDGYPSRLHYFTDWLKDNERNGYITIISDTIGNEVLDTDVGFMTSNPGSYRQLLENREFLEEMALIENAISWYDMRYITKEKIDEMAALIEDGDIIAFVSAVGGLDVSHTGLALHRDGKLHLLHASSRSQKVEITPVPLSEYLKDSRNVPGILVARVKR